MQEKKKAILVGVNLNSQKDFEYSMEELGNLAVACNIEVVGKITQKLDRLKPSHYIGKGKVNEVLVLAEEKEAKIVIFNDELSPSQIRNLEADCDCEVVDRTMLILDIFAQRAETREAQIQVEVAQLQYMLPRLVGFGVMLERQIGGVGTKNKGTGEKKIELDRRKIEIKITSLNKELEEVVAQRQTQRKQRKKKDISVVSLVGYTNAGKSTIMNALIELYGRSEKGQVFEKDMLFSTLETSVRNIQLLDNKSFLLTDTVGFVNGLPNHLIKAFRSTLEEAIEADLLIHVVDISNPNYEQFINVTNNTLKEIGVENVPTIYAYNKADLIDIINHADQNNGVYLSAKKRTGINELVKMICNFIFKDYINCEMFIPYEQGQVVSYFNQKAKVLSTKYENNGTRLVLECTKAEMEKYQMFITAIH